MRYKEAGKPLAGSPAAEMLRRRSMAGEAGGGWAGAPTPESRSGLVQPG